MLIDLVRAAESRRPDQPLVMADNRTTSYAELLRRAESFARALRQRGIERFGCALEDPVRVLVAAVGATAVSSEVCIYPRDLDPGAVETLAARFDHEIVVTRSSARLSGPERLTIEDLALDDGSPLPPARRAPVLILTTGTTGAQKGARHDWFKLAAAVRRRETSPRTRWLFAYNLNQFAGVQVMLHALVSGSTLVIPASRRADDAIDAIITHSVTHASATPTFWRLMVGRLTPRRAADLKLRQITLGGEAASGGLIERLRELFPEARISHVYAGTEFGSAVSVRDGRSGLPLSVLDRDRSSGTQLRIIDGELHVRSTVGMLGYHDEVDLDDVWRSTGDLVEIRGDRIQFVGRTTEIINVGGAKVHPLPIEELVCGVEGVQLAAVYGRANAVTGQIVAVDVVAEPRADTDGLDSRIREACAVLPAAGRPRRIRFVSELETRGSKLMRRGAASGA